MSFERRFIDIIPPVTKNLMIVNVIVFLFMSFLPDGKGDVITNFCGLHYFLSPGFNPAQLLTYMFVHGGIAHLFFNMFALYMFGISIEWAMGSKRFLFYYLSCGIGAALVQEGVYAIMVSKYAGIFSDFDFDYIIQHGYEAIKQGMNFTDPSAAALNALVNGTTVGASGAIYGVLLAYGMLYPERRLMLMIPPMPIKAKWLVVGYGILELALGITGTSDGVAHFCHLGGMIFGLLMILYWKKKGTFNGYY